MMRVISSVCVCVCALTRRDSRRRTAGRRRVCTIPPSDSMPGYQRSWWWWDHRDRGRSSQGGSCTCNTPTHTFTDTTPDQHLCVSFYEWNIQPLFRFVLNKNCDWLWEMWKPRPPIDMIGQQGHVESKSEPLSSTEEHHAEEHVDQVLRQHQLKHTHLRYMWKQWECGE